MKEYTIRIGDSQSAGRVTIFDERGIQVGKSEEVGEGLPADEIVAGLIKLGFILEGLPVTVDDRRATV